MTKNRNTRPQANPTNLPSTHIEAEVIEEVSTEHPETVEALREVAQEVLGGLALQTGLLSGPRAIGGDSVVRVEVKPILLRGEHRFQFAYHRNHQVTHRNLPPAEAQTEFIALLSRQFRQALLYTTEGRVQISLNRRYEVRIRKETLNVGRWALGTASEVSPSVATPQRPTPIFSHDRPKNHLLPEGTPVPFLIGLGVMTAEGRVVAAKRDKFRQINQFLETVADVVAPLEAHQKQNPGRPLRIVDFGCGKAYLTFALYHYLHVQRGLNIALVGVDRKQDVLAQCTTLAQELQFTGLSFVVGDIVTSQKAITALFAQSVDNDGRTEGEKKTTAEYAEHAEKNAEENIFISESLVSTPNAQRPTPNTNNGPILTNTLNTHEHPTPNAKRQTPLPPDMVVALHACDTATDDALVAGVVWGAQVILVAPCCQHELFAQIANVAEVALLPMVRHGIVRERMTGLITDTLRAEWLAAKGYAVQMLEFVEAEHTPKNLLLRATKRAGGAEDPHRRAAEESYTHFRDFWNLKPYIEEAFRRAVVKETP